MAAQPTPMPGGVRPTPCYLAVSNDVSLSGAEAPLMATRRWRVLALDTRAELTAGRIETGLDDPLVVIRDKAQEAARAAGFEPQRFILEDGAASAKVECPAETERMAIRRF